MPRKAAAVADPAVSIREHFEREKSAALSKWRSWAADLAEGGTAPSPEEIIAVATTLAIADPGVALADDADTIREITRHEAAIETSKERAAAIAKQHGGRAAILEAISDAEAQVKELRVALAQSQSTAAQTHLPAIRRLKTQNSRLFDAPAKPSKATSEVELEA